MRKSREDGSSITRLRGALKTHRQQIGVVLVGLLLGLVIILNVAMAPMIGPAPDPERPSMQLTYFNKKAADRSVTVQ